MRLFGRSPQSDAATEEALGRTRSSWFGRLAATFQRSEVDDELWESMEEVLLGADTVSGDWVINKTGSAQLAALAAELDVPVYVVATCDKFVPPGVAAVLQLRHGPVAEVWGRPPHGVKVRNPYFERVPLTLVRAVLSDRGVLDAALVRKRCHEAHRPSAFARLAGLLGQ